ncbi:hypothetical protein GCM10010989_05920 [Croceicoccus pelagius]|uniref:Uncharacterized protein n=1 Tax=Croceicoccus pelagius TaxID=1703341 RepID=A0A916Y7Z7_9SPHN|nr:hypothetical protein GCM10010989_05920 [Croceicoccus pelagius]
MANISRFNWGKAGTMHRVLLRGCKVYNGCQLSNTGLDSPWSPFARVPISDLDGHFDIPFTKVTYPFFIDIIAPRGLQSVFYQIGKYVSQPRSDCANTRSIFASRNVSCDCVGEEVWFSA